MADTQSIAITPSVTATQQTHAPATEDLSFSQISLAFGFARQRWQNAILSIIGSGALLFVGGFLISEIPVTPNLKLQMAVLGGLLIVGGLALLPGVIRDLFGKLEVTPAGITMRPALGGFSVPWSAVTRCEVRDVHAGSPFSSVKVWTTEDSMPHQIPSGYLSHHDLQLLRRILLANPEYVRHD